MTLEQKIQRILELPHGKEVWSGIQTIQDIDAPPRGLRFEDHPLRDEIVEALKILLM